MWHTGKGNTGRMNRTDTAPCRLAHHTRHTIHMGKTDHMPLTMHARSMAIHTLGPQRRSHSQTHNLNQIHNHSHQPRRPNLRFSVHR